MGQSKRPLLAIFIFVLLLALTAVIGLTFNATAQTGNTVYLPLVEQDCYACKPTPTPRIWHHWDEPGTARANR